MAQHYNQNYSRKEIAALAAAIHDCIEKDRFSIARNENRQENIDFRNNYNLNHRRQKDILLRITADDFCYSVQNRNRGFEHEILFIFCSRENLFYVDNIEPSPVDIYFKFNILDTPRGKRVIVISFHEGNEPISYLFR